MVRRSLTCKHKHIRSHHAQQLGPWVSVTSYRYCTYNQSTHQQITSQAIAYNALTTNHPLSVQIPLHSLIVRTKPRNSAGLALDAKYRRWHNDITGPLSQPWIHSQNKDTSNQFTLIAYTQWTCKPQWSCLSPLRKAERTASTPHSQQCPHNTQPQAVTLDQLVYMQFPSTWKASGLWNNEDVYLDPTIPVRTPRIGCSNVKLSLGPISASPLHKKHTQSSRHCSLYKGHIPLI